MIIVLTAAVIKVENNFTSNANGNGNTNNNNIADMNNGFNYDRK